MTDSPKPPAKPPAKPAAKRAPKIRVKPPAKPAAKRVPKITAKPVAAGKTQVFIDKKTGRARRVAADAKARATERKATAREAALSGV